MKRFVAVLGGSVALSFAGGAWAQDEAVDDGLYVRIAAGASFVSDWEQDFTFNPNPLPFFGLGVPADGQILDFSDGFIAAAALGFNYADGIRTELEYKYARSDVSLVTPVGGFDGSTGGPAAPFDPDANITAHFIMTNFYFDFTNSSRLTPFIGGGVGGAFVENRFEQKDAALAYQARAGVSLALGSGFSLDTEYIYLQTNKLAFGPKDEEFALNGLGRRIDGDRYQSSSVMLSLRKQF